MFPKKKRLQSLSKFEIVGLLFFYLLLVSVAFKENQFKNPSKELN
jgi:hypothetical protein